MKRRGTEARRVVVGCAERAVLTALVDVIVLLLDGRLRRGLSRQATGPSGFSLFAGPPHHLGQKGRHEAGSRRADSNRER